MSRLMRFVEQHRAIVVYSVGATFVGVLVVIASSFGPIAHHVPPLDGLPKITASPTSTSSTSSTTTTTTTTLGPAPTTPGSTTTPGTSPPIIEVMQPPSTTTQPPRAPTTTSTSTSTTTVPRTTTSTSVPCFHDRPRKPPNGSHSDRGCHPDHH